jgi:hypothetical protein
MTIENLLALNVNDHTEKKNNLTYLSWAWAWAEALKADPAATFKVELFDGKCYMDVNGTGMVWVTVTIFGKPMTCMLPVMDYRNKPIPNPDAFAVNTAIMRCMTKALSLHGLGLYIYAGEDLPQKPERENEQDTDTYATKGSVRHTPRGGIGDDLPDDVKDFLRDLAQSAHDLVMAEKSVEALAMIDDQQLEADQRVWLASQMSSSTRAALKKAKIIPTA